MKKIGEKGEKEREGKRSKKKEGSNNLSSNNNGRLLLDNAVKQGEKGNFEGWSDARKEAYSKIDTNPNAYYYRFNAPGQEQATGAWSEEEKKLFMARLKEVGVNGQWGIFSMAIPGRVGYQCSNYYRYLVKHNEIKDTQYEIGEDGKLHFNHKNKKSFKVESRKRTKATTDDKEPKRKRMKQNSSSFKKREEESDEEDFINEDYEELQSESEGEELSIKAQFEKELPPKEKEETKLTIYHTCSSLDEVDLCTNCGGGGDSTAMLHCVECGESYHWFCHSPPLSRLQNEHIKNWRCAKCKICETCKTDENEDQILFCDICDSGHHMFCLVPKVTQVPKGEWLCTSCTKCKSCNKTVRSYTQLCNKRGEQRIVLCLPCAKQFKKNHFCPVCDKVYQDEDLNQSSPLFLKCTECEFLTHAECDPSYNGDHYICPPCRKWTMLDDKTSQSTSSSDDTAQLSDDKWRCKLCSKPNNSVEGRLLSVTKDLWVHPNCVLWSNLIHMKPDGALQGISKLLKSAEKNVCAGCESKGATIKCINNVCTKYYHFSCARDAEFSFFDNSYACCKDHVSDELEAMKQRNLISNLPPPTPLTSFVFNKKLYIPINTKSKSSKSSKSKQFEFDLNQFLLNNNSVSIANTNLRVRCGNITLHRLGRVIGDTRAFHDELSIYPVGFCISFRFPAISKTDGSMNETFVFDIIQEDSRPIFRIQRYAEYPGDPLGIKDTSVQGAWRELKRRQKEKQWRPSKDAENDRDEDDLPLTITDLGIHSDWVTKLIESLPNAHNCAYYMFKYSTLSQEQIKKNRT